jgi:hypothetical protein
MRTMLAWSVVLTAIAACGHAPPPPVEMTAARAPRIDCDARIADVSMAPTTSARQIAPEALEDRRLTGTLAITPPDAERDRLRPGSRWIASAQVCIDGGGEVERLALLRRSGLPGWDRRLCEEIQQWRYQPYQIEGRPVAACTAVTFVYQIHDPTTQAAAR